MSDYQKEFNLQSESSYVREKYISSFSHYT